MHNYSKQFRPAIAATEAAAGMPAETTAVGSR